MTPTERELMAEERNEGETEQEEVSTRRSRRARKRVQDSNFFLFDLYSWLTSISPGQTCA